MGPCSIRIARLYVELFFLVNGLGLGGAVVWGNLLGWLGYAMGVYAWLSFGAFFVMKHCLREGE